MVDRYDYCGVSGLTVGMKQTSDGNYVKYEDYKKLEVENKQLKGLLKEADIKERIRFLVAIDRALADVKSGKIIPHKKVLESLKKWLSKGLK